MKNLINYYYNLPIDNFKKIDDKVVFEVDGKNYIFQHFNGDLDQLYKIYMYLHVNNIYCHEIVLNKDSSMVTMYNSLSYILIKKNIYLLDEVNINEIINYSKRVNIKQELNWKKLWEEKIDYYEYQINQLGFRYKKIIKSFGYYNGLSELAISLVNYVNYDNIEYYVSHKRIKYKEKMDDFLNPVNIIIDTRVRDIAEYFKSQYINGMISIDYVVKVLDQLNLSYDEALLFLSRIIYPSYYFDVYDEIIQDKVREDRIDYYIEKNVYYETFLRKIYKYLSLKYRIPEIPFLK